MSIERNGVTFFDPDRTYDDHPAMKDLRKVSLGDVRFPFGFFLVDESGKTHVRPATEDDRKKTLTRAFPNVSPDILFSQGCHPNGTGLAGCHGGCGQMSPGNVCMRLFEESRRFFGCGCVDVS